MNNTTQSPLFYCKNCDKYVNKYKIYHDMGGIYYKCLCNTEVYPIYPNDKELRKMKLDRIEEK